MSDAVCSVALQITPCQEVSGAPAHTETFYIASVVKRSARLRRLLALLPAVKRCSSVGSPRQCKLAPCSPADTTIPNSAHRGESDQDAARLDRLREVGHAGAWALLIKPPAARA